MAEGEGFRLMSDLDPNQIKRIVMLSMLKRPECASIANELRLELAADTTEIPKELEDAVMSDCTKFLETSLSKRENLRPVRKKRRNE